MKDNEIYTKEELEFFKLIENEEITETPPAELERLRDFWQKIAKSTIKKRYKTLQKFEDFLYMQEAKRAIKEGRATEKEIEQLLNSIDD